MTALLYVSMCACFLPHLLYSLSTLFWQPPLMVGVQKCAAAAAGQPRTRTFWSQLLSKHRVVVQSLF